MSDLRNSRMMGGTRLTIQFRICWIALGIDRFDAFDQVAECGRQLPRPAPVVQHCCGILKNLTPRPALLASDPQQIELADQVSEDDCAVAGHAPRGATN